MRYTRFFLLAGLCAVALLPAAVAQNAPAGFANSDVLSMLNARLPESTIITTIEVEARRGTAHFDTSAAALVALGQAGASERVLNTVLWARNDVDPGMEVPRPRGAFYRAGNNETPLRSFTFMPPFMARFSVFQHHVVNVAVAAAALPAQISDTTPTIVLQGFGADNAWQLVSVGRSGDSRQFRVRSRNGFGGDYFSDNVFDSRDLHPITITQASSESVSVRPQSPLSPGAYALCGQPTEGGWLRVCYEFAVSGSGL
ncbi:MAG TPA: hypothetical protein VKU01_06520 [Bryobacteraceae bacterium]|nr:hypothetical protein [Bryobacteraceae bacterium]